MHHEGQRRDLHRDAVRGKLDRTDPAHHHRHAGKQTRLQESGHSDRPAQPEHLAQRLPIRPPKALEQMEALQLRQPAGIDRQDHKGHQLHRQRGYGRPAHPKFRHPPVSEDQRIGDQKVHPDSADGGPQHDLRTPQCRKIAFQRHHQQRRDHTPAGDAQKLLPQPRHLGLLPKRQQPRLRMPEKRIGQQTKGQRQPHSHAGIAAHLRLVIAPDRSGNQRHHGLGKS